MQANNKHAFLIMAHHNFDQLKCLISLLDHPRNDIYLYIDRKAAHFHKEEYTTTFSGMTIIDRINVNWGGHSQITCEMNLLKATAPNHYQYYHLLSGVDLPIKTMDSIHAFFDDAPDRNYLSFAAGANAADSFLYRICY